MTAMQQAADEVATTALGCAATEHLHYDVPPPPHMPAAYLPLVGQEEQVQLAFAADPASCQALAKSMLAMEPDGEDLPMGDVADAMNELINTIAGAVKKRVFERTGPLSLGLPIFIHGQPEPSARLTTLVRHMRLGSIPAALLVVHQRETGA
jgi:hypothetical protein